MKTRPIYLLAFIPALAAAYVVFSPGVAYAETKLVRLGPSAIKQTASYTVDPLHTFTGFEIGHLGLSQVQGRFDKLSGSLQFDAKDLSKSNVQITILTSSMDTNVPLRDNDLRSDHFFDVEKFPQLTFTSTKISRKRGGYIAEGNLTLKGISKSISIRFKQYGPIKDAQGKTRIGVVAEPITIHRSDFGINYDATLISDEVVVRLSLEATQDKPASG